jgi:hypothetical protein
MPSPTPDDDDEDFLDAIAEMGDAASRGDADRLAELDAEVKRRGWK